MSSVWDHPRPPALVPCERRVRVQRGGVTLADSVRALKVLETSHPPTIYVPPTDVRMDLLAAAPGASLCEFKGRASYLAHEGTTIAWTYRDPVPAYAALRDHVAFYPGRVDAAWLGEERVRAQEGDFYGGWITDDVLGPSKGAPGTLAW